MSSADDLAKDGKVSDWVDSYVTLSHYNVQDCRKDTEVRRINLPTVRIPGPARPIRFVCLFLLGRW